MLYEPFSSSHTTIGNTLYSLENATGRHFIQNIERLPGHAVE
jgi:hypothetical protein